MKSRLFFYWKKKISSLRREDSDVRQDLDAKQKHLRELRDSKTNAFKRFGQHMPSLLEEVEIAFRQGQFKHKPVGPLGKKDSFSAFSKTIFGLFLCGFYWRADNVNSELQKICCLWSFRCIFSLGNTEGSSVHGCHCILKDYTIAEISVQIAELPSVLQVSSACCIDLV